MQDMENKQPKDKEMTDKKDRKFMIKRKKRTCAFCTKGAQPIDYKYGYITICDRIIKNQPRVIGVFS